MHCYLTNTNFIQIHRERSKGRAREVQFKDGINPGDGTSSSGGEEMASPPPPSADAAPPPKKVKIKRKKKVKVKPPKEKRDTEDNPTEDPIPPPPKPDVPYPFCPPGILYQVNLPYASKKRDAFYVTSSSTSNFRTLHINFFYISSGICSSCC